MNFAVLRATTRERINDRSAKLSSKGVQPAAR
jgi:hypothetical protein